MTIITHSLPHVRIKCSDKVVDKSAHAQFVNKYIISSTMLVAFECENTRILLDMRPKTKEVVVMMMYVVPFKSSEVHTGTAIRQAAGIQSSIELMYII